MPPGTSLALSLREIFCVARRLAPRGTGHIGLNLSSRQAVSRQEQRHSHGRKVEEVMTLDPVTITEHTPLDEIVELMERHRIKRVPVMRGKQLVGIVSRANLVQALASLTRGMKSNDAADWAINDQILAEFKREMWAPIAMKMRRFGKVLSIYGGNRTSASEKH